MGHTQERVMRNATSRQPPSGDLPLVCDITVNWPMMGSATIPGYIEFENAGMHHDRLRTASILKHGEAECLGAVDEQPADEALIVLDHPISATVLSKMRTPPQITTNAAINMMAGLPPQLACSGPIRHKLRCSGT